VRLSTFVDHTVRALSVISPEECFEARDLPTNGALFTGAAGHAFFLHEVARVRREPAALALAHKWCDYAEIVADEHPDGKLPNASNAVFTGRGGKAYVRTLVSALSNSEAATRRAARDFARAWDGALGIRPKMPLELMLGAAGFACAAHDLLCRCPQLPSRVAVTIQHVKTQAVQQILEGLEQPIGERLGELTPLAHGIAGQLLACVITAGPTPLLKTRIEEFVDLAIDEPPLMLWPKQIAKSGVGLQPASWCNGIAGIVLLICRAARVFESEYMMDVARRSASMTFRLRLPSTNPTLCCGTAGQALALAAYGDLSGDARFRRRSLDRLRQAVTDSMSLRLECLWQGRLGVALAALVTVSGERFFPVIEPPVLQSRRGGAR
jgi:hypothetical protein